MLFALQHGQIVLGLRADDVASDSMPSANVTLMRFGAGDDVQVGQDRARCRR